MTTPSSIAPEITAAIFGGSFNPVHQAHMALARTVLERGLADEVWFVPCRRNPLKEASPLFSDSERIEMLRLAIAGEPENMRERMRACDVEYSLPEPSYTARTLKALHRLFPTVRFRLLIGGDSLRSFSRWRDPEQILQLAPLIIYPRPDEGTGDTGTPPLPDGAVLLEDAPLSDISSSEIRRRLEKGEPTEGMLNKNVEKYILNKEEPI